MVRYCHVDVFGRGPLSIKLVKFCADWIIYSRVTATSCFMAKHQKSHAVCHVLQKGAEERAAVDQHVKVGAGRIIYTKVTATSCFTAKHQNSTHPSRTIKVVLRLLPDIFPSIFSQRLHESHSDFLFHGETSIKNSRRSKTQEAPCRAATVAARPAALHVPAGPVLS